MPLQPYFCHTISKYCLCLKDATLNKNLQQHIYKWHTRHTQVGKRFYTRRSQPIGQHKYVELTHVSNLLAEKAST